MATFVLVHGTTAGGWVWKPISRQLRAAGHEVYAPTLTGLGDRVHLATPEVNLDTHITDIVNVLQYEDLSDVVLVGHSYGGMVIAGVAERVPERIAHLVFHDALVPHDGESLIDHQSPERRREMEERVRTLGEGWKIPLSRGPNDVSTRNEPHPWASWTQKLKVNNPAAVAIPRTYLRCTADKGLGGAFAGVLDISYDRAKAGGWRIREMDTVHQISPNPDIVAKTLLELF